MEETAEAGEALVGVEELGLGLGEVAAILCAETGGELSMVRKYLEL